MSEENKAKYLEAFDAIDADGAGSISKGELEAILGEQEISADAVEETLRKFDTDKDGMMDKEEYLDFVYCSMLEQARTLLKIADTSGDGKISKEELGAVFEKLNCPPEQAEEAIANADDDGSGTLSIDEIVDYLMEV